MDSGTTTNTIISDVKKDVDDSVVSGAPITDAGRRSVQGSIPPSVPHPPIKEEKKPMDTGITTTTTSDTKKRDIDSVVRDTNNLSGAPITDVSRPSVRERSEDYTSKEKKSSNRKILALVLATGAGSIIVVFAYFNMNYADYKYVTQWSIEDPSSVATDLSGFVYVDQSPVLINSEKGQYETIIHKYTSNGNPIKTWNTNSSGGGIATDLYGNVYALSAPQVKVFTTNGSLIRVWNSGDLYARNIATDSSGTVYTLGENVSKLTNEGTLLTRWHISGDGMGIAGGPYNSIYILARHHSFLYSIEKFTNSGQLIATWNKTKGTTDGQLQ